MKKNLVKRTFLLVLFITLSVVALHAQGRFVTGTVKDAATDEPLAGAVVYVDGSSEVVLTDNDGNYSIAAGADATIVFSLMGFMDNKQPVSGRSVINVALETESTTLNDVVVIGYGTVKKKDLTGSVSSLSASKLNDVTVTNPQLALQGRVPGVVVTQTNFSPSGGLEIRIRGTRSFNASNDPLYVVDGMLLDTGLSFLDPGDIESIDILKDASATAIYGSRGANGVVIVTTKKGREGRTTVEYNGYVGYQEISRQMQVMDAAQWIEYVREGHRQGTGDLKYNSSGPSYAEDSRVVRFTEDPNVWRTVMSGWNEDRTEWDPSKVKGFDWVGAVTRPGFQHNHNLSVRGGSAKTRWSVGATYTDNIGVVKLRSFNRITARSSIDSQISRIFKIGMSFSYSKTNEELSNNLYSSALAQWPAAFPMDADNNLVDRPGGAEAQWNILNDLVDGAALNQRDRDRMLIHAYVEAKIIEGLTFKSSFNSDIDRYRDGKFNASNSTSRKGDGSTASVKNQRGLSYTWENMLVFDRMFGKHHVGATFVQSIQDWTTETSSTTVKNVALDSQKWYNFSAASEVTGADSSHSKSRLASFLGRLQYGYDDRYLVTMSLRYDGASVLSSGHKWVPFPSAAFAWRISNESFMDSSRTFLDDLKLRIGWGRTGNASVSPYATLGGLTDVKYMYGDGTKTIGYWPSTMANPNLGWEYTEQSNIGLDFSFLKGRISGSVDGYYQSTKDLLMSRQLPIATGYESILFNVGKTRNYGVEASLSTVNIKSRSGFTWTTDFVVSHNREEIVELYNGKVDDVGNKWFIGQPLSVYYGYAPDGIWQNTPEDLLELAKWNAAGNTSFVPGCVRVVDQDGDYRVTPDDRVIVGNPRPKITGGITSNMYFKGFDFSFMMYIDCGRTILNNSPMGFNARDNQPAYDYWTKDNPSSRWPGVYIGSGSPTNGSDYMTTLRYEDGSFARMKEMTLGYSLPDKLIRKANMQKVRFYVSVNNPFIITKFTGVDPEGARGTDYPVVRTYMFGVNLSF